MKGALVIFAIMGGATCLSCDGSTTGSRVGRGDDLDAAREQGASPGRAGRTVVEDWPVVDAEPDVAGRLDSGTPVPDASPMATVMPDAAAAWPDTMPDTMPPAQAPPDAAPPDVAGPDVAAPVPAPRILRARDLTVTRLTAGVVYAHRLNAKTGHVAMPGEPLSPGQLAPELGAQNLKVEELEVDILYAHDIEAGSARLQESHVEEVKFSLITP